MSRLPLICANWKMNYTASEATRFAEIFLSEMAAARNALDAQVEVAIAPPHPVLDRLGGALAGSGIQLAAQNLHADESGAFTGEVSLAMLIDLGCRYALIGHSERRQLFGEGNSDVAAKALRLQGSALRPILCVGETLDERERDTTLQVVGTQILEVLDVADGLSDELVVAYEPTWAIGTGRTATPDMAQEVHAAIRKVLSDRLGEAGGGAFEFSTAAPSNRRTREIYSRSPM